MESIRPENLTYNPNEKVQKEMKEKFKSEYTPEIIDLARQAAAELLKSGEEAKEVEFGHESGSIIVSRDPEKVVWTESVDVDGETFYIGLSEK